MNAESGVLQPTSYGCLVGEWWVAIDFEAQAIAVTRQECRKVPRGSPPWVTEDTGHGVLLDRDSDGRVVGVEILG